MKGWHFDPTISIASGFGISFFAGKLLELDATKNRLALAALDLGIILPDIPWAVMSQETNNDLVVAESTTDVDCFVIKKL